ncbi:FBXW7 family protein [Megaselia abdita]
MEEKCLNLINYANHHNQALHHRQMDDDDQLQRGGGEDTVVTAAAAASTTDATTNEINKIHHHHINNLHHHRLHHNRIDSTGTGIFLETPIIEESTISMNSHDYENAKPKRLSDEFLSQSSDEDHLLHHTTPSADVAVLESLKEEGDLDRVVDVDVDEDDENDRHVENVRREDGEEGDDEEEEDDEEEDDNITTDSDVQSMDAIERRDFEHEQRLTGGRIMKMSSLTDGNNCLKLNLLNRKSESNDQSSAKVTASGSKSANSSDYGTAGTSGVNDRIVSSDSKCTYKSITIVSTPTSSRQHTSRLSKSSAKINLISSLSLTDAIADGAKPSSSSSSTLTCPATSSSGESSTTTTTTSTNTQQATRSKTPFMDLFGGSNSSTSSSVASSSNDSFPPRSSDSRNELPSTSRDPVDQQQQLLPANESRGFCEEEEGDEDVDNIAEEIMDVPQEENPQVEDVELVVEDFPAEVILNDDEEDSTQWPIATITTHTEPTEEEVCTCPVYNDDTDDCSNDENDPEEKSTTTNVGDLSLIIQAVSIYEEQNKSDQPTGGSALTSSSTQRKRKLTEINNANEKMSISVGGSPFGDRKRMAYDIASTPRSSSSLQHCSPQTAYGRRTPRSVIPSKDNPPPELQNWLIQYQQWSNAERLMAVDRLIEISEPTQVRHILKVIEPQFQRDFISLLPKELALNVLSYLEPKDLLKAAQTCNSWRFLCDDNLLWKEKCRQAQILVNPKTDKPKRGRAGNMPSISSPWKAAFMRQHIIETNWRSAPIREPKVLKGHDDHVITCLQFSGNRIVSGSDDNTLKVWSAVTGKCLRTLVGHTGGVWSSQMSGNIIISGSTDRTLKVWDMETGDCVHTLLGHTSTVRCMHLHGKKVVSGSRDATLRVWDIEKGSCLHLLVGHLAAVRCVQYDGKLIVSGAYDYMVKIWHPEREECLHTLQGHTNRVYSLQFDGIHVVSGSLDTSIRVWEAESGNCKHTLMGHQSLTSGMELRKNILVSGNADSTVKVWDITTGQCLQTLSGPNKHQSAVTCLQFNSRFVITSSDDGTVKLWDVKTGEFIRNLVALDSGGSGGVVWRIRYVFFFI